MKHHNFMAKTLIGILTAVSLSACGAADQSASRETEALLYSAEFTYSTDDYVVSYLDYDEFFLKDGESRANTGRYADITEDGKFNWSKVNPNAPLSEGIIQDISEVLTVNDKPLSLPCRFEDLGEEYAVFDLIDFKDFVDVEEKPFTYTDPKTGNKITAKEENLDNLSAYLLDKDSALIMCLRVDKKSGKITKLSSSRLRNLGKAKITVDGIGVGSTLNEMYEKLGAPSEHDVFGVLYDYKYDGKEWSVLFRSSQNSEIINGRDGRILLPKSRMLITDIAVTFTPDEFK
ncbi:MAG: hypothetical protein Q4A72_04730 [Bacillota bacterium]|nr:hypothetical protein [Bacillota bacterium]